MIRTLFLVRFLRQHALVVLGCVLISGCGAGLPATAPVQGKITWKGQPVDRGTIVFYPANGRPAIGQIQSDGSYRLTTFKLNDGALLGTHAVTIEASIVSRGEEAPKNMEEEARRALTGTSRREPPKIDWLVPPQYSHLESSGLTAEVIASENVIDFVLP